MYIKFCVFGVKKLGFNSILAIGAPWDELRCTYTHVLRNKCIVHSIAPISLFLVYEVGFLGWRIKIVFLSCCASITCARLKFTKTHACQVIFLEAKKLRSIGKQFEFFIIEILLRIPTKKSGQNYNVQCTYYVKRACTCTTARSGCTTGQNTVKSRVSWPQKLDIYDA